MAIGKQGIIHAKCHLAESVSGNRIASINSHLQECSHQHLRLNIVITELQGHLSSREFITLLNHLKHFAGGRKTLFRTEKAPMNLVKRHSCNECI